jgi:PIN domain nuclease of toxin-antitoxin system
VKLLLDTHLLLWAAADDPALPGEARTVIEDTENILYFSVASLWEIVFKSALGRDDFQVHACSAETCLTPATKSCPLKRSTHSKSRLSRRCIKIHLTGSLSARRLLKASCCSPTMNR